LSVPAQSGSQQLTVSWKKGEDIDGYEIEYGRSKDMKGSKIITIKKTKTTKTILKKLKGRKKYYVRIKAFKVVNGDTYTSEWSEMKNAKTKK